STGGTVFNSEAVEFYRSLGASRIVLDRQVTLSSMKELAERHINIDFEVFILHTLCVYIDGFCTFMHTYGRESMEEVSGKNPESAGKTVIMTAHDPLATADACSLKYSVTPYDAFTNEKISYADLTPTFFKQLRDGVECGACALYDISRTMTKAVKIVGRQLHPKIRIASVGFIRKCLDMLKDGESIGREDYIKRVQGLYRKTFAYENECRGNNCYHPEVINKFERKRPYNFQVTKIQEQSYGR
ncbi:MAG: U32 family peptidase, partial [Candidatus Omnitrophica bacterium]|nr:U32 family peptidase [Candidatus Omnitrophota bacterium]